MKKLHQHKIFLLSFCLLKNNNKDLSFGLFRYWVFGTNQIYIKYYKSKKNHFRRKSFTANKAKYLVDYLVLLL